MLPDRLTRRRLLLALALLIGAALFFVLFVDLRAAARTVAAADWRYLLAASAALLAGLACYALRWRWLLGNQPGLAATFAAANVGHGVNVLLPLRLGEPARIAALHRAALTPLAAAASSVVVERLLEQVMRLAALGAAVLVAVVYGPGIAVSLPSVAGAALLLAAALAGLAWLRRRRERVLERWPALLGRLPRLGPERARAALAGVLGGLEHAAAPPRLAVGLLLSAGAWACFWAFNALALRALPEPFSLAQVLALSLGALALAPPSAPAQPGVYHAAIVVPLGAAGLAPAATLTAYAIVLHALLMGWMLALGVVGAARSAGRDAPHRPAAE